MNSLVVKRSIVLNGNKTSISLEEALQQLKSYARSHQVTIAESSAISMQRGKAICRQPSAYSCSTAFAPGSPDFLHNPPSQMRCLKRKAF